MIVLNNLLHYMLDKETYFAKDFKLETLAERISKFFQNGEIISADGETGRDRPKRRDLLVGQGELAGLIFIYLFI